MSKLASACGSRTVIGYGTASTISMPAERHFVKVLTLVIALFQDRRIDLVLFFSDNEKQELASIHL
jgi:hypothetical protein